MTRPLEPLAQTNPPVSASSLVACLPVEMPTYFLLANVKVVSLLELGRIESAKMPSKSSESKR